MDRETAETMCTMLDDILDRLSTFNNFVNAKGLGEGRTGRAIGTCVTEIDLEILEPIYRAYPDLKPDFFEIAKPQGILFLSLSGIVPRTLNCPVKTCIISAAFMMLDI